MTPTPLGRVGWAPVRFSGQCNQPLWLEWILNQRPTRSCELQLRCWHKRHRHHRGGGHCHRLHYARAVHVLCCAPTVRSPPPPPPPPILTRWFTAQPQLPIYLQYYIRTSRMVRLLERTCKLNNNTSQLQCPVKDTIHWQPGFSHTFRASTAPVRHPRQSFSRLHPRVATAKALSSP